MITYMHIYIYVYVFMNICTSNVLYLPRAKNANPTTPATYRSPPHPCKVTLHPEPCTLSPES